MSSTRTGSTDVTPPASPGITAVVAADAGPVPPALLAVTVKVYAVPLTRPVIVTVVVGAATETVDPPGDAVTV